MDPRSALETKFRRPWEAEIAVRTDERQATEHAQSEEARLHAFVGRAVSDVGALGSAPLVPIDEQLGLYEALTLPALTAALGARARSKRRLTERTPL